MRSGSRESVDGTDFIILPENRTLTAIEAEEEFRRAAIGFQVVGKPTGRALFDPELFEGHAAACEVAARKNADERSLVTNRE